MMFKYFISPQTLVHSNVKIQACLSSSLFIPKQLLIGFFNYSIPLRSRVGFYGMVQQYISVEQREK